MSSAAQKEAEKQTADLGLAPENYTKTEEGIPLISITGWKNLSSRWVQVVYSGKGTGMMKTLLKKSSARAQDEEDILEESEKNVEEENPEEENISDYEDLIDEALEDNTSDVGLPEAELVGQNVHEEGIPDEQELIEALSKNGAGENSSGEESGGRKAEDKILFENRCTVDRNLYFEAVQAMSNRKKDLIIAVVAAILVPVGLIMDNRTVAVIALIIAVVALSYRPLFGLRDFHRLEKRHPEGQWIKNVRIYSECVITSTEDEDQVTVVPIEDLKKIRNTEHLYILDFGKKAPATLMDKEGFLTGSPEELQSLMKNLRQKEADRRANS